MTAKRTSAPASEAVMEAQKALYASFEATIAAKQNAVSPFPLLRTGASSAPFGLRFVCLAAAITTRHRAR
jgi:hypothetical protein